MTADSGSPAPPRARALPDLPLGSLEGRSEDLARRWALALLARRSMEELGEIPLEEIARHGPVLCRALLDALRSDEELERLAGGGEASRAGRASPASGLAMLAGARDAPALVDAAEALRGVLWEALLDELNWQSAGRFGARQLADLADRLAHVCARVLALALAEEPSASGLAGAPSRTSVGTAGGATVARAGSEAVILDERSVREEPPRTARDLERRQAAIGWESPSREGAEIEIRDQRAERGSSPWTESIQPALEQLARESRPFAVLLVEPLEKGPLGYAGAESERVLADLERMLAAELLGRAPAGSLAHERAGRYWLLAPEIDRVGVSALAGAIGHSVPASLARGGAALRLAVGTALCPEDGHAAAALLAHAEVGLHAARSAQRASLGSSAG